MKVEGRSTETIKAGRQDEAHHKSIEHREKIPYNFRNWTIKATITIGKARRAEGKRVKEVKVSFILFKIYKFRPPKRNLLL